MDGARQWDIVHLDPMYPHRDKQALPQKEMQILRELTGSDPDADTLLRPALAIARRRVVVKRPSHAPFLAGREPAFQPKDQKRDGEGKRGEASVKLGDGRILKKKK